MIWSRKNDVGRRLDADVPEIGCQHVLQRGRPLAGTTLGVEDRRDCYVRVGVEYLQPSESVQSVGHITDLSSIDQVGHRRVEQTHLVGVHHGTFGRSSSREATISLWISLVPP